VVRFAQTVDELLAGKHEPAASHAEPSPRT